MKTIDITTRQEKSICTQYRKGVPARELADRFDISVTTVLRLLRDNKVKIRPRGRPSNS